ncbi:hypothetical protein [Pigmentiphaga litoralis]|uniref:hypothetical protein n=1 Tax=Pigmentiphaga litoralis TaxID=516702 RepID=UPI003B42E695
MTDAHSPAAPAAASAPDMERFRLKRFLESLGDDELDHRADPIPLTEIAAVLEGNPRAVWFDAPGGETTSLCGSVVAGRNRIAQAFGTTPDGLLPEIMARLRRKGRSSKSRATPRPCSKSC